MERYQNLNTSFFVPITKEKPNFRKGDSEIKTDE